MSKNDEVVGDSKHYDIGVLVGRFQIPSLHNAHGKLIESVQKISGRVAIMVGVSKTLGTKENPLDYSTRFMMLRTAFPNAIILPIMDEASDDLWSKNLDTMLRATFPVGSIRLYGGRDSFLPHYKGRFDTFEFPEIKFEDSSTECRKEAGIQIRNTEDFRAGIIYSTQNQYPKVHMTVDVAVIKHDPDEGKMLLLGHRVGAPGDLMSLPGGFVDPSDESLEDAAKREVMEETGFVFENNPDYLGSFIVDDWRYKTPDQKIMTALFAGDYLMGGPQPNEEFDSMEFERLNWDLLECTHPSHQPLVEAILRWAKVRRKKDESVVID